MAQSLVDIFRPQVALFLVLPPILFLLVGIGLSVYFWGPLNEWLIQAIANTLLSQWVSPGVLSGILGFFAILLLLVPSLIVGTSIFFSALLVPRLVRVIRDIDYQEIQLPQQGLSLHGTWVSIKFSSIYLIVIVLTFPISLLIAPLGFALNWWALGYFNAKLFSREILAELMPHADVEGFLKKGEDGLISAGLVTGLLYFVPLFNLLAPTYTALVMTRLCLEKLRSTRIV